MRDEQPTSHVEVTYSPGRCVVIAYPGLWMFVSVDPASSAIREWWAEILAAPTSDRALALILEEGLRAVPDFAVVAFDAQRRSGELALRGAALAQVHGAAGTTAVDASGLDVWRRIDLDGSVATITITITGEASPVQLPLYAGVALADSICIQAAGPLEATPTAGSLSRGRDSEVGPISVADSPVEAVQPDALPPEYAAVGQVSGSTDPDAGVTVAVSTLALDRPAESPPPDLEPLASRTQAGPTGATVPDSSVSTPDEAATQRSVVAAAETTLQFDQNGGVASDSHPPAAGLIDSVPWTTDATSVVSTDRSPPASGPPLPAASAPVAAVGQTMRRDALHDTLAGERTTGPTVKAVRCITGHLNPPLVDRCRTCEQTIEDGAPFTAPRPVLGALCMASGDRVVLDRDVVLGRAPEIPAGRVGDRPNLLRVASPGNDVSRSHLEVRLDGWHVLAVDLGSVNGTIVVPPGGVPERLRPFSPVSLEPGTKVVLADEVSFVYEVGL